VGSPPAQQCVSEYESVFQIVVRTRLEATLTELRHVFVIVILATGARVESFPSEISHHVHAVIELIETICHPQRAAEPQLLRAL
jgi:hypothetical protein